MGANFSTVFIDPFLLAKSQSSFTIDSLSRLSPDERKEKLKEIAAQFEAILIDTILKTERETEKLFRNKKEDTFGMNLDFYREFSDYYFSRAIVSQNGLGLQEYLVQQLNSRIEEMKKEAQTEIRVQRKKSNPVVPERISLPVEGKITSKFGLRKDPFDGRVRFHRGIDIEAPEGTPVKAFMGGKVVFAGRKGGYGNLVILRHRDGKETYYAHLKEIDVSAGDKIESGEVLGKVGSTGRSTGPHLHFEIRVENRPVNPEMFIRENSLKMESKIPILKLDNYFKGGMRW